jgi:hypothetical protein
LFYIRNTQQFLLHQLVGYFKKNIPSQWWELFLRPQRAPHNDLWQARVLLTRPPPKKHIMFATDKQSTLSHIFCIWSNFTTLPFSAVGLLLTYLERRCTLRGKLVTITYTVLLLYWSRCWDNV